MSTADSVSTGSTDTALCQPSGRPKLPYAELLSKGSSGWCYVFAAIILWDALAEEDEQLTRAFRRGLQTRKILVSASWGYLTGHLFGVIPDQYDLIHLIATAYRKKLQQNVLNSTGEQPLT